MRLRNLFFICMKIHSFHNIEFKFVNSSSPVTENLKILQQKEMRFSGPLLPGITPTHSVRLYIQRQMERIRHSEVATENPFDNDVIDTLLVWQLLEMVVQQQVYFIFESFKYWKISSFVL